MKLQYDNAPIGFKQIPGNGRLIDVKKYLKEKENKDGGKLEIYLYIYYDQLKDPLIM